MSQVYHSNARTNSYTRGIIQKSDFTNVELAKKYNVNVKTVAKHKARDFTEEELPLEGIKAQDLTLYITHCRP